MKPTTIPLSQIINTLTAFAPPAFQEDYDNSGLQVGAPDMDISGILITLDVTEAVLDEAVREGKNLIVAHHPLTLKGLTRFTGATQPERIVMQAIQQNLAIYAAHTNIDSVENGVSTVLAQKLGLNNIRVLAPRQHLLQKLVTFVPHAHLKKVREAIFDAGAGVIGKYDCCSFNLEGTGTFRAGETAHPFVGDKGNIHSEPEIRLETILPKHLSRAVIEALIQAHPYEEVAYDLYPLDNTWPSNGFGAVGDLPQAMAEGEFLKHLKHITGSGCIRHTRLLKKPITRVALCGGSGSFLLQAAKSAGAQIFVSADFKYHQFFEADNRIVIADIGHYESEQFTKELFHEILTKKFPNFAVHLSKITTNPIKYY